MSSEKLDSTAGGKKRDPDFINAEIALKRAARKARQRAQQAGQKAGRKARDNPGASAMSDYANMLESIRGLASSIQAINQKAVREYTPVVEAILRSPIPDTHHIERTLDGLLDFCGYEPALHLYKKLCRYYFYINPTATVEYIEAYRELWDSDQEAKP
ncbi:MAG: hypothetical protein Q8K00_07140 [Syntrophales bacterium]|nr:hypothetical protein [Syntrophales bacterium]